MKYTMRSESRLKSITGRLSWNPSNFKVIKPNDYHTGSFYSFRHDCTVITNATIVTRTSINPSYPTTHCFRFEICRFTKLNYYGRSRAQSVQYNFINTTIVDNDPTTTFQRLNGPKRCTSTTLQAGTCFSTRPEEGVVKSAYAVKMHGK